MNACIHSHRRWTVGKNDAQNDALRGSLAASVLWRVAAQLDTEKAIAQESTLPETESVLRGLVLIVGEFAELQERIRDYEETLSCVNQPEKFFVLPGAPTSAPREGDFYPGHLVNQMLDRFPPGVTLAGRIVLCVLVNEASHLVVDEQGKRVAFCCISNSRLARLTGLNVATVRRWLDVFVRARVLLRVAGGGERLSRYQIDLEMFADADSANNSPPASS